MTPSPSPRLLSGASAVAAVILAGGGGSRMGGAIKANLSVGGVRLLDRVTAALGEVGGPLLVAHGRIDPVLLMLDPGLVAVSDPDGPIRGPLAGLAAAARWCAAQPHPPPMLVSVAVDTPFLPADFVAQCIAALGDDHDVVMAAYGDQVYPTNAVWRLAALAPLLADGAAVAFAGGGLKGLAGTLRAQTLAWPERAEGDPFANLNTPEDQVMLNGRAAVSGTKTSSLPSRTNGVGKDQQTR